MHWNGRYDVAQRPSPCCDWPCAVHTRSTRTTPQATAPLRMPMPNSGSRCTIETNPLTRRPSVTACVHPLRIPVPFPVWAFVHSRGEHPRACNHHRPPADRMPYAAFLPAPCNVSTTLRRLVWALVHSTRNTKHAMRGRDLAREALGRGCSAEHGQDYRYLAAGEAWVCCRMPRRCILSRFTFTSAGPVQSLGRYM